MLVQLGREPPPWRVIKQLETNLCKRPLSQLEGRVAAVAKDMGEKLQFKVNPPLSTARLVGVPQQQFPLPAAQPAQLLGQNVPPLGQVAQRLVHQRQPHVELPVPQLPLQRRLLQRKVAQRLTVVPQRPQRQHPQPRLPPLKVDNRQKSTPLPRHELRPQGVP